jgi:hypothetical protein
LVSGAVKDAERHYAGGPQRIRLTIPDARRGVRAESLACAKLTTFDNI